MVHKFRAPWAAFLDTVSLHFTEDQLSALSWGTVRRLALRFDFSHPLELAHIELAWSERHTDAVREVILAEMQDADEEPIEGGSLSESIEEEKESGSGVPTFAMPPKKKEKKREARTEREKEFRRKGVQKTEGMKSGSNTTSGTGMEAQPIDPSGSNFTNTSSAEKNHAVKSPSPANPQGKQLQQQQQQQSSSFSRPAAATGFSGRGGGGGSKAKFRSSSADQAMQRGTTFTTTTTTAKGEKGQEVAWKPQSPPRTSGERMPEEQLQQHCDPAVTNENAPISDTSKRTQQQGSYTTTAAKKKKFLAGAGGGQAYRKTTSDGAAGETQQQQQQQVSSSSSPHVSKTQNVIRTLFFDDVLCIEDLKELFMRYATASMATMLIDKGKSTTGDAREGAAHNNNTGSSFILDRDSFFQLCKEADLFDKTLTQRIAMEVFDSVLATFEKKVNVAVAAAHPVSSGSNTNSNNADQSGPSSSAAATEAIEVGGIPYHVFRQRLVPDLASKKRCVIAELVKIFNALLVV